MGERGEGHCLLCCKVCFLALAWPPSLQNMEESLRHVDATFFLGKVGFLVTGGECTPAPAEGSVPCALPAEAWLMGRTSLRRLTCCRSF